MADPTTLVLPIFGVPVRFEADDPELLGLVDASFGSWREGEVSHRGPGLRVRLHRSVEDEGGDGSEVRVRIFPDGRMVLSTAASVAIADPGSGEAFAYLSRALLANADVTRVSFLDALAFRLIAHHGRTPFHAAVVTDGEVGLLLTGTSGAGKSSIAYACARAGLGVVTEEIAWVQTEPRLRVWGRADALHLLPDGVRFFPELAHMEPVRRPNGKEKIVVDLSGMGGSGKHWVDRLGLCIVARSGGPARLDPIAPDEAMRVVLDDLSPGFDIHRRETVDVLPSLVADGCWRLDPGPDPSGAVPLVTRALREIGNRRRPE